MILKIYPKSSFSDLPKIFNEKIAPQKYEIQVTNCEPNIRKWKLKIKHTIGNILYICTIINYAPYYQTNAKYKESFIIQVGPQSRMAEVDLYFLIKFKTNIGFVTTYIKDHKNTPILCPNVTNNLHIFLQYLACAMTSYALLAEHQYCRSI